MANQKSQTKKKDEAKSTPKRAKRKDGTIELEFGDVRIRVKESTVKNAVLDIVTAINAIKNTLRPMEDVELNRYLEEQKKRRGGTK